MHRGDREDVLSQFSGYFVGVPEFRAGVYFVGIFVEIPGPYILGLSSRRGHS